LTTKILDALSALELRMTELMKDARPETAMIAQRASSVTNDTIMALAGAMIELIRKYRRARPSVMEYFAGKII
jgi:hypothetical protein